MKEEQLDQFKLLLIKKRLQEALEEDKQNTLTESEEFFDELLNDEFNQY